MLGKIWLRGTYTHSKIIKKDKGMINMKLSKVDTWGQEGMGLLFVGHTGHSKILVIFYFLSWLEGAGVSYYFKNIHMCVYVYTCHTCIHSIHTFDACYKL